MRVIGSIPHPILKITVFHNDGRWSVKFENNLTEQIYKFRDGEGVDSLATAITWADEKLMFEVEQQFMALARTRVAAVARLMPPTENEFETII